MFVAKGGEEPKTLFPLLGSLLFALLELFFLIESSYLIATANKKINIIKNPSFEFIDKKYIKAIISGKGNLSYSNFLRKIK